MPNNKYLYLSSINSPSAADFQVNLPENLIIQPYSEVRAVSVRVNPNDNAVSIQKDVNDRLYIGIDFWNKVNQAVPPLMVELNEGIYSITELMENIRDCIEHDALRNFCFARGGLSVTSNNNILTFKLSAMQMYGIPLAEVPDGYIDEMDDYNTTDYDLTNGDVVEAMDLSKKRMVLEDTIYGLDISHDAEESQRAYFCTAGIVQGLVNYDIEEGGNSKANAPKTAYFEIDTSEMEENDKIYITCGQFRDEDIYNEAESKRPFRVGQLQCDVDNLAEDDEGRLNIYTSNNGLFYLKITDGGITFVRPRLDITTGEYHIVVDHILDMTPNAKLTIAITEFEQYKDADKIDASFYNIEVDETVNDGADYENLISEQNYKAQPFAAVQYQNEDVERKKRYLVEYDSANDIEVLASFAMDDEEDRDGRAFNRHTGTFVKAQSLNTNLNTPFTVFVNVDPTEPNAISSNAINNFAQYTNFVDNEKSISNTTYEYNEKAPNAGPMMGYEENNGIDFVGNSFGTGIVFSGAVEFEEQIFPQYYLDIPTLPLGNLSANYLQGRKNTFICPIDLQANDNNVDLYTSQLYTMNYNQLTNSYPLNINTMKIRICNIDGSVAQGINKETIVCLEIRDNPDIKNDQMIVALRGIEQNYTPGSQTGNFIKDQ